MEVVKNFKEKIIFKQGRVSNKKGIVLILMNALLDSEKLLVVFIRK